MIVDVKGHSTYVYTGGKTFDAARPVAVFVHGTLHDHSVWALQSRYFAHHGFSVLAPDAPGHSRSAGAPLTSIDALADWIIALLDATGVTRATLIGHSMGSLIALEAAAHAPERIARIALVGSAYPMRVSDALLDAAQHRESEAIALIIQWSFSSLGAKPSCPGPGFWLHGVNRRLMEWVSARGAPQLCHTDLLACDTYRGGEHATTCVSCPVRLVTGRHDLMTPPRAARTLAQMLAAAGETVDTVTIDAGHLMMAEAPDATLDALYTFAMAEIKHVQ
jgi:pimeloyl-ACP methyl ester carboxylesterase